MRSIVTVLVGVTAIVAAAGCSAAAGGATAGASDEAAVRAQPVPDALATRASRADSVRHSFTAADVAFMTGMIHHHAQALVMSRMAPSHGASPDIQLLTQRIINGQKGEIALMQTWLRDHGQPAPEPAVVDAGGDMGMNMPMMHGEHMMPGMLTPEQMAELDAARGAEWDRLFLTFMIQHHQGAVTMVDRLFASGGAQGDAAYKLASGIAADQASEIDRMRAMLADIVFATGSPP